MKKITRISTGLTRFIKNEMGELVPIPIEIQQIQPIASDDNLFKYYSQFFLDSAEILKEQLVENGNGFEMGNVPVLLYLNGLELVLKSKLYNIDNQDLSIDKFGRKYSHDINKLLNKLETKGKNWKIGLDQNQIEFIKKTGNDYKKKLYNYANGINHSNHLIIDTLESSEIVKKIIENIE